MGNARLKGLDSVRGVAALIVVMCHMFRILFLENDPFKLEIDYTPLQYLVNGRLSVIIFFVLSGFVLNLSITGRGENFSYSSFAIKRFFRIYIPYLIVMAAVWEIFRHVAQVVPSVPAEWQEWSEPKTWQTMLGMLFMGGFVGDDLLNSVVWTLFVEMQIALVFPLMVWVMRKYHVWALLGFLVVSHFASKAFVAIDGNIPFFEAKSVIGRVLLTTYYAQFFAVGIFVAQHMTTIQFVVRRIPKPVHIAAIIVAALIPYKFYEDRFIVSDLFYLAVATGIVVYAISFYRAGQVLSAGILQWLGRISYSLYLVHMPLLMAMTWLFYRYLPMDVIMLLTLPVIFITAEVTHRFVEVPAMDLGRRLAGGRRAKATV